jgi:hypothetical protein
MISGKNIQKRYHSLQGVKAGLALVLNICTYFKYELYLGNLPNITQLINGRIKMVKISVGISVCILQLVFIVIGFCDPYNIKLGVVFLGTFH